jgi:hypothetical protein
METNPVNGLAHNEERTMADTKPTEVKDEDVVVPAETVRGADGKQYVAEIDPKSLHNYPVVDSFDHPKLLVEPAPVEETPAVEVGKVEDEKKEKKVVDKTKDTE